MQRTAWRTAVFGGIGICVLAASAQAQTGPTDPLSIGGTSGGAGPGKIGPGLYATQPGMSPGDTLGEVVRDYRRELADAVSRGVAAARPDLDDGPATTLATSCTAHVVAAMTLVRLDPEGALALLDNVLALLGEERALVIPATA